VLQPATWIPLQPNKYVKTSRTIPQTILSAFIEELQVMMTLTWIVMIIIVVVVVVVVIIIIIIIIIMHKNDKI